MTVRAIFSLICPNMEMERDLNSFSSMKFIDGSFMSWDSSFIARKASIASRFMESG